MKASSAWLIFLALPAAAADIPALFDAIRAGDTTYIKAHLTKPELEARDRRGSTPLMHAAAFGNRDTLKLLIDAGADVRARNDMGATGRRRSGKSPPPDRAWGRRHGRFQAGPHSAHGGRGAQGRLSHCGVAAVEGR